MRRVLRGALEAGSVGPFSLSGTTVADNAAVGTVVGTLAIPAGYTVDLLYDCNGRFAISGNTLVTNAAPLRPDTYQPIIRAIHPAGKAPAGIRSTPLASYPDVCVAGGDLFIDPTITVTSTFSPADISGLVGAWDFNQNVTLGTGSNIASVGGAFGTSISLVASAGNVPTIVSGYGPGGKDVASFDYTQSQYLAMSSAITNIGDMTAFAVIKIKSGAANQAIIGNETDGGHWRLQPSTQYDTNFGTLATMSISGAYGMTTTRFNTFSMTHSGSTGTAASYIDNTAGATASVGTTLRSFNRVGRRSSASPSPGNYWMSILLIYNRVLSSTERAQVEAFLENYRSREWYYAPANIGTGTGHNAANASGGVSTVSNSYRPGDRLLFQGGQYFDGFTLGTPTAFITSAAKPVTIGAWGTGKPIWRGAGPSALPWAIVSGDVWTTTYSRTSPLDVLWWYPNGLSGVCYPVANSFSANPSGDLTFGYTSATNTLNIQLGAGVDPNTQTIIIPADSTVQTSWGSALQYMDFDGISIRHYADAGWYPQAANNRIRRSDISYNHSDGCSGGIANGATIDLCHIQGNGHHRSQLNGDGDGISFHGGTGLVARGNHIIDNHISGMRNYGGVGTTFEGNVVENSNQGVYMLYQSTVNASNPWTIRGNVIVRTAADQTRTAWHSEANTVSNSTITDNRFTGLGSPDAPALQNLGGGTLTQSGNVESGFLSLT